MKNDEKIAGQEVATFGGGCFWGVEEAFLRIDGVTKTEAGYMGGTLKDPTYEMVCTGTTGHAEVVQVTFDPANVSYEELLAVFFEHHDPTTINRQGPDSGEQYRSVIFFHSPVQKDLAETSKRQRNRSERFRKPIVTQIVPASEFYRAEEYHQQYVRKNGLSSCHM